MKTFGELEKAHMRLQFRQMYQDLGFIESVVVLEEIIETAALLADVLSEEVKNDNP